MPETDSHTGRFRQRGGPRRHRQCHSGTAPIGPDHAGRQRDRRSSRRVPPPGVPVLPDRRPAPARRHPVIPDHATGTLPHPPHRRCPGRKHRAAQRGYRRINWIERAIEPLRDNLDDSGFERLISALAMVIGWVALIVLEDLRGLPSHEQADACTWPRTHLSWPPCTTSPRGAAHPARGQSARSQNWPFGSERK